MMWSRSKIKEREWRKWFALVPTIVHDNPEETKWVWLEFYEWKWDQCHILRRPRYSRMDPYRVPRIRSL